MEDWTKVLQDADFGDVAVVLFADVANVVANVVAFAAVAPVVFLFAAVAAAFLFPVVFLFAVVFLHVLVLKFLAGFAYFVEAQKNLELLTAVTLSAAAVA